jgi:hypothetical protein
MSKPTTPTTIKYRGQLYKLAEGPSHKRCKEGTHWNEKQQKCLPLPPDLERANHVAHMGTLRTLIDNARSDLRHAGRHRQGQEERNMSHWHASIVHNDVARLARKHGFNELAEDHKALAAHHSMSGGIAAPRERMRSETFRSPPTPIK